MGRYIDSSEVHQLAADLAAAPAKVAARTSRAIQDAASEIEQTAKQLVPVDTGRLRESISSAVKGPDTEVGPTVYYGRYVEFGTSREGPQPFMRPAFDRHKERFVKALEDIVGDTL